ncbi:hypothetical protein C4K68_11070 [Pokkaliibacter plantistimulans]|uniref:Diguanylate cyclase n=1 Tax=Proteobacteria bacterium 228 TaxID=2083153 RepID=A0A2S5KSA1_9PROT|nr:hypothetical protein C4K68_11070 [Pokkaliibacter plantistimulans]
MVSMKSGRYGRLWLLVLLWLWQCAQPASAAPDQELLAVGDARFPPYEYLTQDGQPAGFNIDLLQAIARESKLNIRSRLGEWHLVLDEFNRGDAQIIAVYASPERRDKYLLSDPITITSYILVRNVNSPSMQGPSSLGDREVVVQAGSYGESSLLQNLPHAQLIKAPSEWDVLRMVNENRYAYGYVTFQTAGYMIHKGDFSNVVLTGSEISSHPYVFAVAKGNTELLNAINTGLDKVKASGEFDNLYNKWFRDYYEENFQSILAVIAAILIAILLMLLWVGLLRYQIAKVRSSLDREYQTRIQVEKHLARFAKTQQWITNFSNVGIWVYDYRTELLEINGTLADTLSLKTIALRLQLDEVLEGIRDTDHAHLRRFFSIKIPNSKHICECLVITNDVPEKTLLLRGRLDEQDEQAPGSRAVGILLDVTATQTMQKQLQRSERSMEVLVANIPGAVFRVQANQDLEVSFVSAGLRHIIGSETLPKSSPVKQPNLKSIIHPADWILVRDTLCHAADANESFSFSHRVTDLDGNVRWVLNQGQGMIDNETGVGWIEGVFFDETDQILNAQRLDYLAHRDPLTGLANRYTFQQRAEQALQSASRNQHHLAFILMDLDNFKAINDSLGHNVGDEVLMQISTRLADTLRANETLCRIGGDEFVVVVPQVFQTDHLLPLIRRLREALTTPVVLSTGPLSLTTSIGVSVYPEDGTQVQDLLKSADTALYESKASGKNTFTFFTSEMGRQTEYRFWIETELRRALEQRQLHLVYQPQFSLDTLQLYGLEVLIRWNHPEAGFISPADFIPIAESAGLIQSLGHYVQETSLQQLRHWLDQGFEPGVLSINASVHELGDAGYYSRLIKLLEHYDIARELVTIEVTESIFIDDNPTLKAQLNSLVDQGIRLAIDDFGKGYSSLSYIKKIRADLLKIDQSFVQELGKTPEADALVMAMVSMANALDIRVLAEGCEDERTLEILKNYGCHLVQGYLLARPMPADQLQAQFLQAPLSESDTLG